MDRPGCFHGANAEDDVLSMLDNVFSSRATLNFDREFTFFQWCWVSAQEACREKFISTMSVSQNHSKDSHSGGALGNPKFQSTDCWSVRIWGSSFNG